MLTAPVARAIDAYLAGRDSGPIFVTKTGRRMDQPEAWRMIRCIARRAGLGSAGEIRPHSLRVAFITGAREAGVPLEDVQDAAGHADPEPLAVTTAAATRLTGMPRMPLQRGSVAARHRVDQRG